MASSDQLEQIKHAINQLKLLTSESQYESDDCLNNLNLIDKSYADNKLIRTKIVDLLVTLKYPELCYKLLKYYQTQYIFSNDSIWYCGYYLLHSLWNYSDLSKELCLQLSNCGYIPILLTLISDSDILKYNNDDDQQNKEQLLKMSMNIMHNIAQIPETKVVFRENKATNIIKTFSHINHDNIKILAYLCLAHILNEDETRELNDGVIIKHIISNLKESLKKEDHKYKGMSAREYLHALAKLAVNKDFKVRMYECNTIGLIREIIKHEVPNEEQKHALNCLWSLVFDEEIRENVKKDRELLSSLKSLCELTPSDELRRICAGITHTINEFTKKILESKSSTSKRNISSKNHVMISYNSSSRDICLKIRDKLKSDGVKVWMDIEQIQGSALQSMADAVENSAVILICMSERYYQSPNCRLEAEYAVRLNKPIVPLLLQTKYQPQGWLGIAIGTKIYYDFAKYSIEEKYSSFFREIQSFYSNDDSCSNSSSQASSPVKTPFKTTSTVAIDRIKNGSNSVKNDKNHFIHSWSCKDVEKWLNKLNLKTHDLSFFDDIDGQCLHELYEMKLKTPEFFMNILKEKFTFLKKNSIGDYEKIFKLSDLLRLSSELSILFKEE